MSRRTPPRSLTGQVAAITGGARGIGRATAAALLREGMHVAIGDLDAATVQQTATELGAGGGQIRGYAVNVADAASMRAFVDAVEDDFGPIDVFDNNAGIMPVGRFLDESPEATARQLDVNIGGVLNGAHEILPRFAGRGRGHLVNVASMAGRAPLAGIATYSGTKSFVIGFSEAIRAELRWEGSAVEVSCVMPAMVQTELATGLQAVRGVEAVTPEAVAEAIVSALKRPRFDVPVPAYAGKIVDVMGLFSRRTSDRVSHLLGADASLITADQQQRQRYEERAADQAATEERERASIDL